MVRVLTTDETQAFLARHSDLSVNNIPPSGVRVYEYGKDYLVGVNHNTNMIYVMDITAYDPDTGERIDPSIADQSEIHTIYDAVIGGVYDTGEQIGTGTLNMFDSVNDLIAFVSQHLYIVLFIFFVFWFVSSGNFRKFMQGVR